MIQILKDPRDCPSILSNQGRLQTVKDCRSFKRASKKIKNRYLAGFPFPSFSYYSSITVKRVLLKVHNYKCCFCEQKRRQSELAVEHFRPKTAVKQTKGGKDIYPGYFWLAYDWNNLYLSCSECNGRFKRNYFPLLNPKKRAISCEDDIRKERPLLVNPGKDNPREHIRFRMDRVCALTRKGYTTIDLLQLDEENLRKAREEKMGILNKLVSLIALADEKDTPEWRKCADEARQQLADAIAPEAEFSSMALDFLTHIGYLEM